MRRQQTACNRQQRTGDVRQPRDVSVDVAVTASSSSSPNGIIMLMIVFVCVIVIREREWMGKHPITIIRVCRLSLLVHIIVLNKIVRYRRRTLFCIKVRQRQERSEHQVRTRASASRPLPAWDCVDRAGLLYTAAREILILRQAWEWQLSTRA